jgi:hypothetical protein
MFYLGYQNGFHAIKNVKKLSIKDIKFRKNF